MDWVIGAGFAVVSRCVQVCAHDHIICDTDCGSECGLTALPSSASMDSGASSDSSYAPSGTVVDVMAVRACGGMQACRRNAKPEVVARQWRRVSSPHVFVCALTTQGYHICVCDDRTQRTVQVDISGLTSLLEVQTLLQARLGCLDDIVGFAFREQGKEVCFGAFAPRAGCVSVCLRIPCRGVGRK